MKNFKIFSCCLLFLMLLATGCNSSKPVVIETKTETVKTITEKVHDTIFKIEKDSSSYKALMECVNGKVKIKDVVNATPGRNLKPPKVSIKDNILHVDCEAKAQELFAQWKSKFVSEYKAEVIPIKVNELTFWQEFQIKGFRLFLLVALGFITYKFIKFYLKR